MDKLSSVLSGVSGEYFVAAELSRRGHIASITLRNTKGVDILCSNAEATETVGIQVKTSQGSGRNWLLNQKAENYFAQNLFYIFVNLTDGKKLPEFFIVPSGVVANFCKESPANWLKTTNKKGQKHNDSPMRKFVDLDGKYLDHWELLGL